MAGVSSGTINRVALCGGNPDLAPSGRRHQNVWFFVTTILPFILPFWQEADMFNYARYLDTF
jgi:hypothetical protein